MGTSLFNTTPAATYPALIKVGNNTSIDGTLKTLSDGAGNDLPIQVSSTSTNFTGTVGVASQLYLGNTDSLLSTNRFQILNAANTQIMVNVDAGGSLSTTGRFQVYKSDRTAIAQAMYYDGATMIFRPMNDGVESTSFRNNAQTLNILNFNGVNGNVDLNIGSASLGAKLGVRGSGSTSATTSFLVTNGAATPLNAMQITDNLGIIFAGKGQDNAGVYIGRNVAANWTNSSGSVVIGDAADVAGNAINQVIIGKEAIGTASNNINIGYKAGVLGASNGSGILIGNQAGQHGATNYPSNPIGIGGSVSVGTNSISIGTSAKTASVANSIAIGNASEVYFNPSYSSINGIALGANSFANTTGLVADGTAIAIGYDAYASYYEFVSGAPTFPIKDVYFGSGVIRKNGLSTGVGVAYTINGSGAFGTNFAGGNLTLAGGKGTGTGTAGNVIFSTSTATTSGTTLQTLSERMRIDGSGNVGIGTSSPTARLQVDGNMNFSGGSAATQRQILFQGQGIKIRHNANDLGNNTVIGWNNDALPLDSTTQRSTIIGFLNQGNVPSSSLILGTGNNLTDYAGGSPLIVGNDIVLNASSGAGKYFGCNGTVKVGFNGLFAQDNGNVTLFPPSTYAYPQSGPTIIGAGVNNSSIQFPSICLGQWASDSTYATGVRNNHISTTNGSGTNVEGYNLHIMPGRSTGNATPKDLIFNTTDIGGSGTSYQSYVSRWYIKGGTGALANVASPTAQLQVKGSGTTSATTSLLVQNSSDTTILRLNDAGTLSVGNGSQGTINAGTLNLSYPNTITYSSSYNFVIGGTTAGSGTISIDGSSIRFLASNNGIRYTQPTAKSFLIQKEQGGADQTSFLSIAGADQTDAGQAGAGGVVRIYGGLNNGIAAQGLLILAHNGTTTQGAVVVGGTSANAAALLDIQSTTKGFLYPRMTTAERTAITSPPNGLMVFDTDVQNLCYRRDSTWVQVSFTAV